VEDRKEKQVQEILDEFRTKEIQMAERLFQAKRSLYLLSRKRREQRADFSNKDKVALERLNQEVQRLTKEEIEQKKTFRMSIQQYTPESSSLKQQGPVPPPPEITSLPLGVSRRRIIVGKNSESNTNTNNEDGDETETENEEVSRSEKENENESEENQEGGDVKIIHL